MSGHDRMECSEGFLPCAGRACAAIHSRSCHMHTDTHALHARNATADRLQQSCLMLTDVDVMHAGIARRSGPGRSGVRFDGRAVRLWPVGNLLCAEKDIVVCLQRSCFLLTDVDVMHAGIARRSGS